MVVLVDFDGTCVSHAFPRVGKDIGAAKVLKRLVDNGHKIILFTMRSAGGTYRGEVIEDTLTPAINWFKENQIPLLSTGLNPTQGYWTYSLKPYGHLIIDDICAGIPMVRNENELHPYVDWPKMEEWLEAQGWFNNNL